MNSKAQHHVHKNPTLKYILIHLNPLRHFTPKDKGKFVSVLNQVPRHEDVWGE